MATHTLENIPMDLTVHVRMATKTLWEGKASSVSSINSVGVFDILPLHAQFVTLVRGQYITIRSATGESKIFVRTAVIHNHDNTVSIYIAEA